MNISEYIEQPVYKARNDILDLSNRLDRDKSPLTEDEWQTLELAISVGRLAVSVAERAGVAMREPGRLDNDLWYLMYKLGVKLETIISRVKEII